MNSLQHQGDAPTYASDSSEYLAAMLGYARKPITVAFFSLVIWALLGTPHIANRYTYRGSKNNVVLTYAISITGERTTYPHAMSFVFFTKNGRYWPVVRR